MRRIWLVALAILAIAACEKTHPEEHLIEFERSGLGSYGPMTYRIRVDLDRRTLEASAPPDMRDWKDTQLPRKVSKKSLTEGEVVELRALAAGARAEEPGPDPHVTDSFAQITLDGDHEIKQPGPMTAPFAKQLEARLIVFAGW